MLPSAAILGFGLITSLVLGVAVGYAITPAAGSVALAFTFGCSAFYFFSQTKVIKVDQDLKVGKYQLPRTAIANLKTLSHAEFRTDLKATNLVLGTNSAASYLRIELTDAADPYQVWYVATKRPAKLMQALS